MDRIDTPGSVNGEFRFGNPFATPPIASTIVGATWLNGIQEELAFVIEQAGLALDQADNTQLRQAILLEIANVISQGGGLVDTFTAPSSGSAGAGVLVVDTFGVALEDFTIGNPVTLQLSGQFLLPKNTGVGNGFTHGGAVFWDGARAKNSTAGVVHLIGYAAADAGDSDPDVLVRLNGVTRDTV